MNKLLTLTALGTVLLAANANAAGFHLREQSAAAQGNAFAGATAGAENNSYAYFNAAGLTRQKGTQFNIGGTYIAPKARAENVKYVDNSGNTQRGSDVNNIVHAAVAPNMNFSHQLDEKTFLGVSLNVPYGMVTKYDKDWAGSDHGITSKVTSVTVTPMAAYKATDKLSLGAGVQLQYMKAKLTNSASGFGVEHVRLEGDTFDIGYQLGALYEFNDNTRIGLGYRSEVKHKLKGEIEASPSAASGMTGAVVNALLNQDISAHLTTPAMASIGLFHQLNEKWAVMAEYQRVFWSSFDYLTIMGEDTKSQVSQVKEKWRDTNFFAVGASYQIDNQWKWRLGLAYDQSAVRMKHRTPRIPDSDRLWYSTGLNYQYNDKLSFDLAYTYIYAHKAHMHTQNITPNDVNRASVDFTNSVQLFGFSLNYKF
ncbi:MAG: transporter [Alphaproteobacteria bacterium]|nr:transporter [Alphaproteobacteria bacterium]